MWTPFTLTTSWNESQKSIEDKVVWRRRYIELGKWKTINSLSVKEESLERGKKGGRWAQYSRFFTPSSWYDKETIYVDVNTFFKRICACLKVDLALKAQGKPLWSGVLKEKPAKQRHDKKRESQALVITMKAIKQWNWANERRILHRGCHRILLFSLGAALYIQPKNGVVSSFCFIYPFDGRKQASGGGWKIYKTMPRMCN